MKGHRMGCDLLHSDLWLLILLPSVSPPRRTVSYGLGNAPRKKRSAQEMSRATELLRCECANSTDGTCVSFCHTRNTRR